MSNLPARAIICLCPGASAPLRAIRKTPPVHRVRQPPSWLLPHLADQSNLWAVPSIACGALGGQLFDGFGHRHRGLAELQEAADGVEHPVFGDYTVNYQSIGCGAAGWVCLLAAFSTPLTRQAVSSPTAAATCMIPDSRQRPPAASTVHPDGVPSGKPSWQRRPGPAKGRRGWGRSGEAACCFAH